MTVMSSYVCALYGFNTTDINEVRYKVFMHIGGSKQTEPLARIKKINHPSLPPSFKAFANHINRSNFVAKMWKRADQVDLTSGESPINYMAGWTLVRVSSQIGTLEVLSLVL